MKIKGYVILHVPFEMWNSRTKIADAKAQIREAMTENTLEHYDGYCEVQEVVIEALKDDMGNPI